MTDNAVDDYLATLPDTLRSTAEALRAVIDAGLPDAVARVWHGHPVWLDGKTPVAGLKAYTRYVTFLLWRGQEVDDPTGRLNPGSGDMASVRLTSPAEIDTAAFTNWLKQL